jgi:GH24 family phage-related lysozyme (muramidase)
LKVVLTEDQINVINSKLIYEEILDEMVFSLSLLFEDEEREPDMEWDFTQAKDQLEKASSWVKTKEDAVEFIRKVKDKVKALPEDTKRKIFQYVMYSVIGLITVKQFNQLLNQPIKKVADIEQQVLKPEEAPRIRQSSPDLLDHIRYEEGSIYDKGEPMLRAYDLGDGAYTIGYGHAIFKGENEGYDFLPNYDEIRPGVTRISKKQAELLLKDDIKIAEGIVNEFLDDWESKGIKPKLTQGMYNTLISMTYNMGRNIRTKDFLQSIKRGDFEEARELIKQTSSSLFDDFPGLKSRREKEAKMFV